MNWQFISNERFSLQQYQLMVNNDCKLLIKYNPRHQSARTTCDNHHRLFFFESAGSLSGKTIFKNEYGMEIGHLVHDKFRPKEGSVVIDTQKYQYKLQNDSSPELVIYETALQKPLATCNLPTIHTLKQNILSPGKVAVDNNCYLLGLCWYLLMPSFKENVLKFASAGF